MRDAIARCRERGIPATRENVREAINDACWSDREVSKDMMRNWTSEKSEWSPIRIGDGDELRDTDDEAVGWDDEVTV